MCVDTRRRAWPDRGVVLLLLLSTPTRADDAAAKARFVGPSPVPVAVDRAALAEAEKERGALPEKLAAAVTEMKLPMLLPADEALVASARMVQGDGWCGATMSDGQVSVYVHATTRWFESPTKVGAARDAVSMTDGIATIALARFGVAYTIDVECVAPGCDARGRAEAIRTSLRYVGGGP